MAIRTIIELLRADGSIVVNKKLAKVIGLQEAILYSELISKYLYFENDDDLDKDGYFYNTADNIKDDTTLSKFQQSKAIEKLVKLGLIEYDVRGLPATRYFKITENNNIIKLLSTKKDVDNKKSRKWTTGSQIIRQLDGEKLDSNNTNYNTNYNTKIFTHWLNQNIYKHKKNTFESQILKKYSLEEILTAITNYGIIVNGEEYYWSYKWTLGDFLKRGLDRFMDLDTAKENYRANGKSNKKKYGIV